MREFRDMDNFKVMIDMEEVAAMESNEFVCASQGTVDFTIITLKSGTRIDVKGVV